VTRVINVHMLIKIISDGLPMRVVISNGINGTITYVDSPPLLTAPWELGLGPWPISYASYLVIRKSSCRDVTKLIRGPIKAAAFQCVLGGGG
jgi:hypothetical protein